MAANQRPNPDVPPDPADATTITVTEEVRTQIDESRILRKDANEKVAKAEESVSEMTNILRRIAQVIDSNPHTWDDLFNTKTGSTK